MNMLPHYRDAVGGFHTRKEGDDKKVLPPEKAEPTKEVLPPEHEPQYPAWFRRRYSPERIRRAENLSHLIQEISTTQNEYLKNEFGSKFDLINKFGMLDARMFADTQGGNIPKQRAESHKKFIEQMERRLAAVEPNDNEDQDAFKRRRAIQMKKFDISAEDTQLEKKLLRSFQLERGMSENFQLEKAFVITFAKLLGPEFVVFRAPEYEDYKGTDTYIFDTVTGRVVCALDEVLDKFTDDEGANNQENKRVQDKIHTARTINERGGKFIEYGLKIVEKNGRRMISRESVDHTPLFSVAIKKSALENVLQSYKSTVDPDETSPAELQFFDTIVNSWRNQAKALPQERRAIKATKSSGTMGSHSRPTAQELSSIFDRMNTLKNRFVPPSNT